MGAIKFIEEYRRMYKVIWKHLPTLAKGISAKDVVKEVEEWSATPPRKTMQSVFLEQWPDAIISHDGLPEVAPCQLCVGLIRGKSTKDCEKRGLCDKCRREFWMQEVE